MSTHRLGADDPSLAGPLIGRESRSTTSMNGPRADPILILYNRTQAGRRPWNRRREIMAPRWIQSRLEEGNAKINKLTLESQSVAAELRQLKAERARFVSQYQPGVSPPPKDASVTAYVVDLQDRIRNLEAQWRSLARQARQEIDLVTSHCFRFIARRRAEYVRSREPMAKL